ncbi:V-type ATP synthase subunit I [Enterococcus sp. CWB-B31]|uniref:V-type ATP synthase subunit I n=1 Tax=Enterococcus sp. CWB-B31 TaxID=2885159 RepID=UPI001E439FB8|nr:V-type ATP synthase subunit I [Enterococcus sp. CWB-B31]MCB5955243.1 V-type ATP synthase subunit I [Enterococcus sp. CWB-B31]
MAVNKMEKVTIIAAADQEETILQAIQGLQAVEIKDFYHSSVDQSYIDHYFSLDQTASNRQRKKFYEEMLLRIHDVLLFIDYFSSKEGHKNGFKRRVQSLDSLESSFNQEKILGYLSAVESLKRRLDYVNSQRKKLLTEEDWLTRWQALDVVPQRVILTEASLVSGSINAANNEEFQAALKNIPSIYYEELYYSTNHVYYSLIYLKENEDEIGGLLNRFSFERMNYPYDVVPSKAYENTKKELVELVDEEKTIKKELGVYRDHLEELYLAEEMIYALIYREQAKDHLLNTHYFCLMQGWIPEEEKNNFLSVLNKAVPETEVYLTFEQPTAEEIQMDIPVKLKNNKVAAPFEMLTEMYSLPKYDEIDPTPVMTPFYMVFFGMMVADLGYGLLMFLITMVVRKNIVLNRVKKRFVDFFFILSFPTIVWGIIYGSFFGVDFPKTLFSIHLPFPILSTTEDVNTILLLSVAFGFIQLMTGLIINGIELMKRKQYLTSIGDSFAWQGLLTGILIAVLGMLVMNNNGFFIVGITAAVISALSIVAVPVIQSKSKVKGIAKGLYELYNLTGYIGDLVSYTRLMALGISGGSIAAAFNMLVAFMPPIARFTVGILLIIALHTLNLFLSLLGAYVHGARLQYVEFFGKFYSGGGRAFQPLKAEEKHLNIEKTKLKK